MSSRSPLKQPFELVSKYQPTGDQPQAIDALVSGFKDGVKKQILLGVTGSGKTFTTANVALQLGVPTLVLAHNKTLAAQLYSEFKALFPNNAVRYFVSYYDYYQPEAYVPSTDTYIEKDSAINDEIDMLRHAATKALLERQDVIIVASVSCIYGLGDPEKYFEMLLFLEEGECIRRDKLFERLVKLQYERNDLDFRTGRFRARGDVVEICPASESENAIRLEFFGDELESIYEFDRLTGKEKKSLKRVSIYPASHFVTGEDTIKFAVKSIKAELQDRLEELKLMGKELELARLESRTLYDLEMLQEMGFCPGIENYSRHFTGRAEGEPPPTLLDYFPEDFLLVIDESHVTLPQVRGMYRGDISRKSTLVDYGFRLPSALDNRPLNYDEFSGKISKVLYVSATPGPLEKEESAGRVVEQLVRPTGVVDPMLDVRKATNQVEDFLGEIQPVVDRGERVLITTLTKRMSEHLSEYYREVGVNIKYLHSDIHTLDRIELIRALRQGDIDVLVGINLLREGLDLPEVSLVGIMDADKEGFLRSETSLVQTIGRAARNINGKVILYADRITGSMRRAIDETERRRKVQEEYNREHGITPESVKRTAEALSVERYDEQSANNAAERCGLSLEELPRDAASCKKMIAGLRSQMQEHAKKYEFEAAAEVRDKLFALEEFLLTL